MQLTSFGDSILCPLLNFFILVSSAPLLTMLGSGSSEVIYTCLQHVQLLLARQPDMWSTSYQNFFCRYALYLVCTVELCLSDTPQLGTPAIQLSAIIIWSSRVSAVEGIEVYGDTIRTFGIIRYADTPLLHIADTLLGPNSITAHTNSPYSGHFGEKIVDSLVNLYVSKLE